MSDIRDWSPLPVVLYGKDIKIATGVQTYLMPSVEAIHVCTDFKTALARIPEFFDVPHHKGAPQAILFGGKFSDSEYKLLCQAVRDRLALRPDPQRPEVHFVKCQRLDVLAAGSLGPNPETIARVFIKKLEAAMGREL